MVKVYSSKNTSEVLLLKNAVFVLVLLILLVSATAAMAQSPEANSPDSQSPVITPVESDEEVMTAPSPSPTEDKGPKKEELPQPVKIQEQPKQSPDQAVIDKLIPVNNPDPIYVSEYEWNNFRLYVLSGGKWILVDYTYGPGRLQHYTAYEGLKPIFSGLTSSAERYRGKDIDCPKNRHPNKSHNHLGIFRVYERLKHYWSKSHNCPMNWCLFYCNGHGHAMHATFGSRLKKLGRPASGGCTRTQNAKKLFNWAGKDEIRIRIKRDKL